MKSDYPMTRGWLKLPFEWAAKTQTSAWNESIFTTTSSCLYLSSFRAPRLSTSLNSLKKNWSTQVCDKSLLCLLKLYQEYQDLEARLQERIASPPPFTFFQATCIGYVHSSSSYSTQRWLFSQALKACHEESIQEEQFLVQLAFPVFLRMSTVNYPLTKW